MSGIRVLLAGRFELLEKRGGDTEQILQTEAALRERGIDAGVCLAPGAWAAGVDVIHAFNLTRVLEAAFYLRKARLHKVPFVLTPILHDLADYDARGRHGAARVAAKLLGSERLEQARAIALAASDRRMRSAALAQIVAGYSKSRRRTAAEADAVVLTGPSEKESLERAGLKTRRDFVVPLGVDDAFRIASAGLFHAAHGIHDFVLCAARIEDLKNQLGVIEALRDLPVPLVFAGEPNCRHASYVARVRKAAAGRPSTFILPALDREMVASAMAAARVHILASWAENVGLSTLEAAAAGTPVVSTDRGHVRDYLGDLCFYCDPSDPASIRTAVLRALECPKPWPELRERMAGFTWPAAAALLQNVYEAVLAR